MGPNALGSVTGFPCLLFLSVHAVYLLPAVLRTGAQSVCRSQLASAAQAAGVDTPTFYVDPDTPADACTKQLCVGDFASCQGGSPPQTDLQLVFSDEFESPGRAFGVGAADPRWTAEHMWYAGTQDFEVYLPEQVGASEAGAD